MFLDFPKSRKEWDIAFPLWENLGEKLEKVKITNKQKTKTKTKVSYYYNCPINHSLLMIRRLWFIGHCWRKKDEVISDLLLWELKHGARKTGRPATTYVDQV